MQELLACAERLQCENDQLQTQVEKSRDLGKDVRDGDCLKHLIACNKGKEPIISDDGDALEDDELSNREVPNHKSFARKECSRQHKGQIAKEVLPPPYPQ